jgi:hypothetical protein
VELMRGRYEFSRDEIAADLWDDTRRCVDCGVGEHDAILRVVDGEIVCERCAPKHCRTCNRVLVGGEEHICGECVEEVERTIEEIPAHVRDRYREMAA